MVQVLSDLNLLIKRAYISSDGEWFMDGEFLDFFLRFLNLFSTPFTLYELIGLSETVSLPFEVGVRSSRPQLWDYTGYLVVVVVVYPLYTTNKLE